MTRTDPATLTQAEREAAADALLETVDLEPFARALVDLLYDVWVQDQPAAAQDRNSGVAR
jgi:hypothetical protein